jgi:hypothetical protein
MLRRTLLPEGRRSAEIDSEPSLCDLFARIVLTVHEGIEVRR